MKHRRSIDLTATARRRFIRLECPEFEWETFDSLPQWFELYAGCTCGAMRHVDRYALARRFGKSTYIKSLTSRLFCTCCDQRGTSVFWLHKSPR